MQINEPLVCKNCLLKEKCTSLDQMKLTSSGKCNYKINGVINDRIRRG